MTTMRVPLVCSLLLGLVGLFSAAPARAELDFEFAKGLMEKNTATFPTDELVERLIVKLEANPDTKLDAVLIKATLRRHQSEKASIEKRKALLDEADALYKDFLANGAKHRLFATAETENSSLRSDMVKSQISAAREIAEKDPAKAKSIRAEAAQTMEKIAADYKTVLDAALPKFKEAYDNFKKWNDKNNPEGDKAPPKELLVPLDKNFSAWIVADKRYISAKVDQVECYDDADGAKKTLADELTKLCEERLAEEAIGNFPVIGAWYAFMQGRLHAAVQREDKASESWNNALQMTADMTNLAPEQTKQLLLIKRLILHDLVKMKVKSKKYPDVVEIIGQSLVDTALRPLFEENAGKELMVDYAKAMVLQPEAGQSDFENGVKVMRQLIEKESKPGGNQNWAGRYAYTIAELLQEARKRKVKPNISAQEWYDAARGYYAMGYEENKKYTEVQSSDPAKAPEQFEKAYVQFNFAVDCYRRAISVARSSKSELAARLAVEPKAWFEMGLSYVKMKEYLEAVLAYQSLRDTFGTESRMKWLPDPKSPEGKRVFTKQVVDLFEEYDKAKEGLLPRGSTNLLFSLDKHIAEHKDIWSGGLKGRILNEMKDDTSVDTGISDSDYLLAKTAMEMAKSISAAAREDLKRGNVKSAVDSFGQALGKFQEAGEKFMKVKTTSVAYETALYQAGTCYTMAQEILSGGRSGEKKEAQDAKIKESTEKALESFTKYDEFVAKNQNVQEDDRNRRRSLQGAVLLSRCSLLLGVGDWEKAAKASDDYVAWETGNTVPKSSKYIAYLNKFRALVELAAKNLAPKSEPFMKDAEETIAAYRKERPKDNKTYVFMVNALSRRYLIAAAQAEKLKLSKDLSEGYERKLTELQWSRVEMMAESEADDLTLEDYTRMLFLFNKTNQERRAADWAIKLLAKFDPETKNVKMPDEEVYWQALLEKMFKVIKPEGSYADLQKYERCKNDHRLLVDFMYDGSKGRAYDELSEKRPEYDRHNYNLLKARAQIETIRNNYKDCPTLRDDFGEGGRSLITMIEDEIDFRQKMEATRDLLSSLALSVAAKLEREGGHDDDAKHYREVANQQIKILIDIRGETPAMQIKSAEIDMSTGKYEDALQTFMKVLGDAPKDSNLYFDCKRRISETLALQKKYVDAAEYPEWIAMTSGGFDSNYVKDRWPNMKEFLLECYKNGAKMPPKMKDILEGKVEQGIATPDKKTEGAGKSEEPKKSAEDKKTDEPKKSAEPQKTEEPKKTEQPKKSE
ncbi:MAG: hypothetical protein HY291_15170 [Planctomycetes bacterium]|nr:hypothetical protein [Planctomycetota bacterium]